MNNELIEKCMKYMEEKKMAQVKFAGRVGIGESTMSRYLKQNYPNPENIEQQIITFFEKEEKREGANFIGQIGFAMTGMSQNIVKVLEYCRVQKIVGVIYGDAGVGKTYTCRHWIKDKPDVVMITVNPAFSGSKACLKLIARALKINAEGPVDEIMIGICLHLQNGDKTIIIDEAQHLTRKTIENIRSINDTTDTAIVLVGNETIYSKLKGRQQAEFAQLFSRIVMRSNNLITDMFSSEDVRMVFGLNEENESESEIVDYLLKICKSKYGLRGASHVYNNAKNNEDITCNGLKAMATVMGIAV